MALSLTNVIQDDSEQHSRGFSSRSNTLDNVNARGTVTFKHYNLKRQ